MGLVQAKCVHGFDDDLTVFGLGIAGLLGWADLPAALEVCQSPWVLAVSGALALVEFGADKIPGVDSGWDLLHTVLRIPVGAFLASAALAGSQGGPVTLILAGLAVSSIAAALVSLALNLSQNPFAIVEMVFWMMGSLADRSLPQVWLAAPFMLAGIALLLLLGTPNTGSTCADMMYIVTGNQPLYYATRMFAVEFNRVNSTRKGVRFSALAGNPMPFMCNAVTPNDTFVSVASAHWTIKDTAVTPYTHEELTGDKGLAHFVNDRPTKGIPIFTDFVKPRLAIGPRGDHNPDFSDLLDKKSGQYYQPNSDAYSLNATRGPNASIEDTLENPTENDTPKIDFSKSVKLASKQSVEIEIPVEQANNFGLTFMANAQISATLFDDKGAAIGKNLAKTREANVWFRSIFYDKPTVKGTWKLKLENTSDKEFELVLATWKGVPTR